MVDVDICNMALSYLGDSATVTSIDPPEGSAQAQHCARMYPAATKMLLEAHQWNFATKRVFLAEVPGAYFGRWRYAYALPSDVADMISVLPGAEYAAAYGRWEPLRGFGPYWPLEWEREQRGEFEIETSSSTSGTRQIVLSSAWNAVARYTVTSVQPGMFTAMFSDALAWKLASMLAGPILKGDAGAAESKRCLQAFAPIFEQAKGQDANQRHSTQHFVPSGIAARA